MTRTRAEAVELVEWLDDYLGAVFRAYLEDSIEAAVTRNEARDDLIARLCGECEAG